MVNQNLLRALPRHIISNQTPWHRRYLGCRRGQCVLRYLIHSLTTSLMRLVACLGGIGTVNGLHRRSDLAVVPLLEATLAHFPLVAADRGNLAWVWVHRRVVVDGLGCLRRQVLGWGQLFHRCLRLHLGAVSFHLTI